MRSKRASALVLLFPILIMWVSWYMKLYWLIMVSIIATYVIIGINKCCKSHESVWLFFIVALISVPINFEFSYYSCAIVSSFYGNSIILKILYFILIYDICFSIEEIFFGIIGRGIWREQRPFIECGFEYDGNELRKKYKS